jgi:hypothetical protein
MQTGKPTCGRIAALAAICVVAALPTYAANGVTYWWENSEVARTVTLATAAQNPDAMSVDAAGRYLVLSAGGAVKAVYDVPSVSRRAGSFAVLANSTATDLDLSGAYSIGAKTLSYYGKSDGKVYVSDGTTETELVDLSGEGSAIVTAKVARPDSAPYLNVLLASGTVVVYELAANGLSLASSTPVATATTSDIFSEIGAPALIDVSADGLALFAVTASGNAFYVIRSANWGLVDCVAPTVQFPWRDYTAQTKPSCSTTTMSSMTIPPSSTEFDEPFVWPWADSAIYKKIGYRNGNITNTFSNLTAGDTYRAEYHCAENWYQEAGKRIYSLYVNNALKYANLDSWVVGGNTRMKAFVMAYDAVANGSGQISFSLVKVIDQPIFSGFAILGRELPSSLSFGTEFARDGSTGTLTWGARDALAYYVQSAPSREGPWTTILRDQTAKRLSVTPGAENTVYYRVVASNGVGTVKSAVRCSKREKYTVYAVNCGYDLARHGRFAPDDHHVDSDVMYSRDENLYGKSPELSAANEHSVPSEIARTAIFYVKEAADNMEYAFPNLNPGKTYDVRIYCQETFMGGAGSRVFSLKANGETVISGIDAFARAGGKFTLVEYVCKGLSPDAEGVLSLVFVKEVTDPDISAIEIVENDSARVPLVPVVHGVFARNDGVQVCIGSGTGELTYDVRRRPAAGGEYETLVTGLAGYAWLDAGVREGYVYSVRAVDADGAAGAWSGDVAITPAGAGPQAFLGISPTSATFSNANGAYVPYALYLQQNMRLFEAAQAYSHHLVLDPAPGEVYSRIIYTGVVFNFTNLYPSATYRIRLQALESYYTAAGRRVTSGVYANEGQIWGEFDAYREVGKGVFPIEGIVKTTPEGKVNFSTRQSKDNLDFCTVELFLLDGSTEGGVARAVRSGSANDPTWTQGVVSTLDLAGVPDGTPATGNEFIWDTMISVPADGAYTFDVEQGGDYALWIDDDVCLEAHGGASATATVTLALGAHHLRARYVQGVGEASVAVKWAGPGFARRSIAASSFTKSRTTDLSQDKWRRAEINTAHEGDLYKIGQTADGSDIWRMTSSADGFWGTREKSHFVFREVKSREFEARVRLRNIPDRAPDSTLALTLRTGLTEFGGDYVRQMICGVTNPGQDTSWHVGPQGADFTVANPNITNNVRWNVKVPMWMRVRKWREGGRDLAEFSYSLDEENPTWTVSVTNELTATRPIYVGVEASPYTTERLVTYEFDHFELDVPPPPGMLIILK